MSLSRKEIIDYSLRYIPEQELVEFPHDGELFSFLQRDVAPDKARKDDEGWSFAGYGICLNYELDTEEKPAGKWIWFSFILLDTFPPKHSVMKLQPPHIAKGQFQNATRTAEIKILKIPLPTKATDAYAPKKSMSGKNVSGVSSAKLIQFPAKKKKE
jgi:hypothetical protein